MRGRGVEDLDLFVVTGVTDVIVVPALVGRQELHERVAPVRTPARHAVVGGDVLGEAVAQLVEELEVETPVVAEHGLLHRFGVFEDLQA